MPELPEVETVVRDLRPVLRGRSILAVRPSRQQLRRPWQAAWNPAVIGAQVEGLRRRGKWILIDLRGHGRAPGRTSQRPALGLPVVRIHLGMTGQLTVVPTTEPLPDHVHVVFELDNDTELRFRDPRRFGCAEYFPDRAAVDAALDAELGPEPFAMDPEAFRAAVGRTTRCLKAVLLDQQVVAGVGNIYADEVLFRAGLHPQRPGSSLSAAECDRLRETLAAVLERAIASRGSTIRDYVGGSGLRGGFQNEFAVYGRTDQPCRVCGTPIVCLRLAGRSSHYCPTCQPARTRVSGPATRRRGR